MTHIQIIILVLGFSINFFATIGGFVSFAMAYENRITRIETMLEMRLQPPRNGFKGTH